MWKCSRSPPCAVSPAALPMTTVMTASRPCAAAPIMLRRQQAEAIISARQLIVQNAVGMVHMALGELERQNTVKLDDERKAAMVSNLLDA